MKHFTKRFDYITFIKYGLALLGFLIFNNLEKQVLPYSSALLVALLILDFSLILTPVLYLTSFFIVNQIGFLTSASIFIGVIVPIICIYKKFNITSFYEYLAFTLVGMLGYVFIGNTINQVALDKRILSTILTVLLTLICIIAGKAVKTKGLKFKFGFDEIVAISIIVSIFGLGICNLFSPFIWKSISILIILLTCYIYRFGTGTMISAVLGISLSIYYSNLDFISVYLLYSIFCQCLMQTSRYLSALSILVCDYLLQVIFGLYGTYTYIHFISILLGAVCFCFIPSLLLTALKDKLYSFREKQLVRQSINRNRSILSAKLYDLSGVFSEMANAFNLFNNNSLSEEQAKEFLQKDIKKSVCLECEHFRKCKTYENQINSSLYKLIDIGFAKGKLSFIDIPNELSSICLKPNNILYGLNRSLADYRAKLIEKENLELGRKLIASQSVGVAEILRGLALDTGSLLKFNNKLERKVCEELFKAGFLVSEVLLFGELDALSISLIITMKEFSLNKLQDVISKTLNVKMTLTKRSHLTDDKLYLSFIKANKNDAIFGFASATKDGSNISGDTHSITRISPNKFLVALSDGMGSGEYAQALSSASLSLIESFYKAGLNENLILDTVNKLLTINTEDCFTALDVCVIDLKTCSADFIKYGSPYGFIINQNGIKIVEGNCLPLGIIDGLRPSVANTSLEDDDIILLVTDGISDAFSSSGELIDFLRTLTAKNPQTLAEQVLERAINLNGGQKKDDMTALAVRVYKSII